MEEDVVAVAEKPEQGEFGEGSIRRHIIRLAIPMTAAQLINLLYSIADRMYLGRIADAGSLALTGVGLTLPIVSILMSVAHLCSTGGAPLFSIARGNGDDEEAGRILGNAFALLMIMGVALTAIVIVFKKPILYAFGASDDTYPYAAQYLSVYTVGTVFVMIGLGMNPFINAQGAAKRGMMTVVFGAVVNMILDPVFIFGMKMGATGAALSTIIGQFCSAVWVMLFLLKGKTKYRLTIANMKLRAERVRRILTLGTSGFVMSLTNSLITVVCNRTLQSYGGDLYVGAMTVINAIREIVFMPVSGMNGAATPVLGYNYGAGKGERVKQAIRFSITVAVVYMASMWILTTSVPGALVRIFSNDAELIDVGARAVRLYFSMSIFLSLQMGSQVIFTALGKSKFAIFFSLLRKAIIAAPLTVILPRLGFGTDGVFAAEAVSQVIGGIICFTTMYLTVYRRMKDEELPIVR